MMKAVFLVFCFVTFWGPSFSQDQEFNLELDSIFQNFRVDGAVILREIKSNETYQFNPEKCRERFIPASTFKIPNTLIALEERVIAEDTSIIQWDGVTRWNDNWNKDLSLKEAFMYSCVPCYLDITKKVGLDKYASYLETFDYGNRDITLIVDEPSLVPGFWLIGALRISPQEQIKFLENLINEKFSLSKHTYEVMKKVMIERQTEQFVLRGKTGRCIEQNREIGWYVGYIEQDEKVWLFATQIESTNPNDQFNGARKKILEEALRQVGISLNAQ